MIVDYLQIYVINVYQNRETHFSDVNQCKDKWEAIMERYRISVNAERDTESDVDKAMSFWKLIGSTLTPPKSTNTRLASGI